VVAQSNNNGSPSGVAFSRLRTEFTRQTGQLLIKDGVVRGPAIGGTIEGRIDYNANQVRMSGTFVPMYGLNNMFGQIPVVGLVLGGGSNEGLIGLTYEIVGTPGSPVLRVNPISAIMPGMTRKIFEFGTGRQTNPQDFGPPTQN
ncbi:MAG TPA: AsmA-like C-terminal region-containing protein, partial [Afipia sp.]